MARLIRQTLLTVRDLLITLGPFLLIAIGLLAGAYYVLDPAPPKRVVLATGPAQSDNAIFGASYAEELGRFGIEVTLRETDGSGENRRLLMDENEDVDLAFIRGGSGEAILAIDEEEGDWALESLGSLFYEPLWIFYRGGAIGNLAQLRGRRVAIGESGSGVPNLLMKLFHANGVEPSSMKLSRDEPPAAVAALLKGRIDAVVLASAPESPLVQMLLRTPEVRLLDFSQAEAYSRKFPFLSPVVLPRGMVDFARDLPRRDMHLLASTTMLVAREDTHPALVQLFVQAARRIHGGTGWFARTGQFPNAQHNELPLADEAERYYKHGVPLLQQYLPFWLSNLIDRMWVALFSIIAMLIPLSRVLPPLYAFRVRSRIFRWYRDLRGIEDDLTENSVPRAKLLERLDILDARAEDIAVPLAYTDQLYALRSHIQMVRERLRQAGAPQQKSPGPN
ncbi:MAG: C4-dicarboxylate ABC transporter substrate-binding protein [Betaproteobacteria bacterium RIFCSPLOWO2_02_FULL_62_17]|nr:MAG: C4-dicarboxylate ABC transporter substrate-binding protein [Betaproteobacteria bacterium RIFCSPLOWO2_02_FULL_62_17]